MELDITRFFNDACPKDYSASIAEIGNSAGADTWRAAMDDSEEYFLLDNVDKRDNFRQHLVGMGAWDDNEVNDFNDCELNALLLQLISGDIREAGLDSRFPDWRAYENDENNRGSLFHADGKVYYSID